MRNKKGPLDSPCVCRALRTKIVAADASPPSLVVVQPPAILKGYIDRVVRPPYAYDFPEGDLGGGLPIARLAGKVSHHRSHGRQT